MNAPVSTPAPPRPLRAAALWLTFLGPFFFLTYGAANWLASRRADVGALVFGWEAQIPFVPWTIVPYWSIDLLYAASLFLCATRAELAVHVRRLVAAQVIAVACFVLVPLRFTFERPEVGGGFGLMFDVLGGFDKPFNQAPSLHIALLAILWVLYARHTPAPLRLPLHLWFALIGVSVLTTYQHHFVDLPTGAWVGLFCLWLFPDGAASPIAGATLARDPRRRALAWRYGLGAVVTAAIGLYLGGWGLWLLWAAGSLGLVAAAYGALGAAAFQKTTDGSMSLAARSLLAPYLLGAWLNARWWTRSMTKADAVAPGLLLGRLASAAELRDLGVRSVVDLTAELPAPVGEARYFNVPHLDLVPPSVVHLEACMHAIDEAMQAPPVLVCCALGFSRSAAATAAWLIAGGRARDEAVARIREARPGIVLGEAYLDALDRFAAGRRNPSQGPGR